MSDAWLFSKAQYQDLDVHYSHDTSQKNSQKI